MSMSTPMANQLARRSKVSLISTMVVATTIFAGCGAQKAYQAANSSNTISVCESFLREYPESKHAVEIESKLQLLYEQRDWERASQSKEVTPYTNFIIKYPHSEFVETAKRRIQQITEFQSWQEARRMNTVGAFESFITKYPDSGYVPDARAQLEMLVDKEDWQRAEGLGTVDSYQDYVARHPRGKMNTVANERIAEIKTVGPEWTKTLARNTVESYSTFLTEYPYSMYSPLAKEKLEVLDDREWANALRQNNLKSLRNYLNKFPIGKNAARAEQRIVDLEVDGIFNKQHGELPPLTRSLAGNDAITTIEILNKTVFDLTVRYSGTDSKKAIIRPNQRVQIVLQNGRYRVAASVDTSSVQNYAGTETLNGGGYSVEYFIEYR